MVLNLPHLKVEETGLKREIMTGKVEGWIKIL